ncbi:hypothetical protein Cgig2_013806 [Carnegiea gigantea]|uniref:Uncharacterized protein n=1 Tax=Carnegiea gigantea TaxID=171969 RepID=A0A9Q1K3K2_9CARY|nr:hypothetical protein Cgig2_013806 [Carnegiea gigantea]
MSVKMRTTCTWTERPFEASLFPEIDFESFLRSLGGRRRKKRRPPSGGAEPSMRYYSGKTRTLTLCQDLRAKGQSQALQRVTGACKGFLGLDRYLSSSAKAEGSLTARPTRRAEMKVGLSDPTVPSGRTVAQRINVKYGANAYSYAMRAPVTLGREENECFY